MGLSGRRTPQFYLLTDAGLFIIADGTERISFPWREATAEERADPTFGRPDLVYAKIHHRRAQMRQILEQHRTDKQGHPAGGTTTGLGIEIHWQDGPLGAQGDARRTPNGAFVEDVIAAALGRLEFYQVGAFKCRENALAITKLQEALHWLRHRTADRLARGVEGTHTP